MADIEITDEASLEAWLKTRPSEDAEIIAFRAAARVFPLWGRAMEEEWAEEYGTLEARPISALDLLWMIYRPWVNFFARAPELAKVASKSDGLTFTYGVVVAGNAARKHLDLRNLDGAQYALAASNSLNSSRRFATKDFLGCIQSSSECALGVASDRYTALIKLYRALENDANAAFDGQNLVLTRLWPTPAPDWFTKTDAEMRAIWAKDPPTWAFWEKWWDGVISGDMAFAPELLHNVALIDDDIWQAGPKAVAGAIAQIEKIHDLRAQLAALTQAMEDEDLLQLQLGATLAHRGHNNPPELIEAMAIVQTSAVEIAQGLDDAREELAKPAPDPSRLKKIGSGLVSVVSGALGYCGVLTDKFLQSYAETLGEEAAKWTMRLIGRGATLAMLLTFAKSMIAILPF
jgi:hypothetical protein